MSPAWRRYATGLAAALVGGALMTGCGVPTHTEVRFDGQGPEAEPLALGGEEGPPGRGDAETPEELVEYFLQAAAGSPDTAEERVRDFIYPAQQEDWRPDPGINLVRIEGDVAITGESGGYSVRLRVRQIGELTPNGYVEPSATTEVVRYDFRVLEAATVGDVPENLSGGLYIANPPPVKMLADTALDRHYDPYPIYFWENTDREVLVPDLRWLPRTVPPNQRPDTVVRWLLAGPAPWLRSTVDALPESTEPVNRVVLNDGRVEVNLNPAAGEVDVGRLLTQLTWTLRAVSNDAELDLSIEGHQEDIDSIVPAGHPEPRAPAPYFVVLDGVVKQQAGTERVLPPALPADLNTGVVSAAITRDRRAAALVREDPVGGLRLMVTTVTGGSEPEIHDTGLVAETMSRPVWQNPHERIGLVVADGKLYRFMPDHTAEVAIPSLEGTVTAVAVAPEGRRVALVADGRLYVATVRRDGGSITLQPRPLLTRAEELTGIAFTSEYRLVIAGVQSGRMELYGLTVDGAYDVLLIDPRAVSVTQLVAYPEDPVNGASGMIMYEADGRTYSYASSGSRLIRAMDLADVPEDVATDPRAPFFME